MIKKLVIKYSIAKIRDMSRDIEYEMSQLISKNMAAEEPLDILALIKKNRNIDTRRNVLSTIQNDEVQELCVGVTR